jgi:hypothetical protein
MRRNERPSSVLLMSLASLPARRYGSDSMFPDYTRDSLILDAQILGLVLVVVVVIEATAP